MNFLLYLIFLPFYTGFFIVACLCYMDFMWMRGFLCGDIRNVLMIVRCKSTPRVKKHIHVALTLEKLAAFATLNICAIIQIIITIFGLECVVKVREGAILIKSGEAMMVALDAACESVLCVALVFLLIHGAVLVLKHTMLRKYFDD